jgi:hypothetical protein
MRFKEEGDRVIAMALTERQEVVEESVVEEQQEG